MAYAKPSTNGKHADADHSDWLAALESGDIAPAEAGPTNRFADLPDDRRRLQAVPTPSAPDELTSALDAAISGSLNDAYLGTLHACAARNGVRQRDTEFRAALLAATSADEIDEVLERRHAVPLGDGWETAAALAEAELRAQWLVPNVLELGVPGVIAGPQKSLKTWLALELAASVSTGTKFLGHYDTNEHPCAVLSAESGRRVIREVLRSIWRRKGVDAPSNLHLRYSTPDLGDADQVRDLGKLILRHGVRLLLCDPLYLLMPGVDPKNMFDVGARLRRLSDIAMAHNCAVLVVHHTNKAAEDKSEISLNDIAYAGVPQWVGQWLLVNRIEQFNPEHPRHKLCLTTGGRHNYTGRLAIEVDQSRDADGWLGCRLAVRSYSEVVAERVDAKVQAKNRVRQAEANDHERRVLVALKKCPHGAAESIIRARAKLGPGACRTALYALLESEQVEQCAVKRRNGQSYDGWRRTDCKPTPTQNGENRPEIDSLDHSTALDQSTGVE